MVGYLREHASHFYVENLRRAVVRWLLDRSDADRERVDPEETAGDGPDLPPIVLLSATSWLESTPLMRGLRRACPSE